MAVHVLALRLFLAMLAWVPPAHHAYLGEREDDVTPRYFALAETMAAVALDPAEEPVLGDRELTAFLLASVASFESVFRRDVVLCRVPGLGKAWGAWQFQGPAERVCGSLEQGARWALAMVRESFRVCRRGEVADRLAYYTDGRCEASWWRSRSRVERARRAVR